IPYGKFKVSKLIGHHGFSTVLSAIWIDEEETADKPVVIKLLNNLQNHEEFIKEAILLYI
ncbi:13854_t:CDS:1, partial [Cetraspora pellucida]